MGGMKKFVLISIPTMENAYHNMKDFAAIFIPIGMASIAAVLEKNGYDVEIIDANAEGLTDDEALRRVAQARPCYVGSTCMTATMDRSYDFYSKLKERLPGVKVIVGGPHVSALPKRTLQECRDIDIVVKGEGEDTIADLMQAIESDSALGQVRGIAFRRGGEVVETADRPLIEDLGKLPLPAYHLLKFNLYRSYMWNNWISGCRKPMGAVFTGRGCYGRCNFCATRVTFGQKMRYFPADRIKKEIDILVDRYHIKILYFQDDTFTINKDIVNEVCDHLIKKGYNETLEINISTRVDAVDLPTLKLLKKAGVRWVAFGVESGNQRILNGMNKNISINQIEKAFRDANKAGLRVVGNFMIGHIGETTETAMDTIRFACRLRQDFVNFATAIPLPGSKLYDYCLSSGRQLPSWNGFGSVNSPPIALNDDLGAEELRRLRTLAVNRFFKRPVYLAKMLMRFHAFSVIKDFTKMYVSLRKEIKEKRY